MPHLPIEIEGGSVTIRFPGKEGTTDRVVRKPAADKILAGQDHPEVTLFGHSDTDNRARIFLIELYGADETKAPLKFEPDATGRCLIRVHYVAGDEVDKDIPAEQLVGAKPLP